MFIKVLSILSLGYALLDPNVASALTCNTKSLELVSQENHCAVKRNWGGEQRNGMVPEAFTEHYNFSCTDACGKKQQLSLQVDWDCVGNQVLAGLGINDPSDKVNSQLVSCTQEKTRLVIEVTPGKSTQETIDAQYNSFENTFKPIFAAGKKMNKPVNMPAPTSGIPYWGK